MDQSTGQDHDRSPIASRRSTVLDVAALMLAPALLLAPAIGPGRTVFGIDFAHFFFFMRAWVASELRAGRVPVWDPYTLCGFPLLAALQSGVFYPPTWLETVAPQAAFWAFITWLHLALAGIFARAWLRHGLGVARGAALTGALLFALSGYVFTHLYAGHVGYTWAYPWGAFALWRLERWLAAPKLRRAVLLAVPLPLMILAGVPQLAFATGLLLASRVGYFALIAAGSVRRRVQVVAATGAVLAAGMLLAAPQVLPTLELVGQTQRVAVADPAFVASFSLPPEGLLSFLAPTVFGDGVAQRYWGRWYPWEICGYVSVAGLVLACLGACSGRRQAWFWAVTAVFAVLIALGDHTPLFAAFRSVVPGAGLFRGPGRYLYVFVLAAAALASLGAHALVSDAGRARSLGRRVGAAALMVAVVLGVAALVAWLPGSESAAWRAILERARAVQAASSALSGAPSLPVASSAFRSASHAGAVRALCAAALWSASSGVVLLAFAVGRVRAGVAVAALAILMLADLGSFDRRYVHAQQLRALDWAPGTVTLLARRIGPDFRLTSVRGEDIADAGRGRSAGLAHVGGYDSMLLGRYADLFNVLGGQPLGQPVVVATIDRPHPIAAMLGVKGWLAPRGSVTPPGLRPVRALPDGRQVLESRAALARLALVPRSIVKPDLRERLAALADRRWDPREVVVLEDAALRDEDFGPARGEVEVLTRGTGEYVVDVDAPGGGFLVLGEAWFPGWHAEVEGAEAPLLRANHLVQAVRLEPGRHRVRFVYRSRFLPLGLAIAAATLLLPCAIAVLRRRRSRSKAVPARSPSSRAGSSRSS